MSIPDTPPRPHKLLNPAPSVTKNPPRTSWSRVLLWSVLGCLNVGLIAVAFYFGGRLGGLPVHRAVEEDAARDSSLPPSSEIRTEHAEPVIRIDLEEVDRLLRTGRFEVALAICKQASDGAASQLRDAFRYRHALSLEGMGRWDDAIKVFSSVVSRSNSPLMVSAAQLGQARVWLRMRRHTQGKVLLCDLILRAGDPVASDPVLLANARYMLALALALEATEALPDSPTEDALANHSPSDWSMDEALKWGKLGKDENRLVPPPMPDTVSVKRIRGVNEEILVRATVRQLPLTALLAQVAEQAGLKLVWSALARRQVEERCLRIDLGPIPLTDFLRPICERLDLVWKADKEVLHIWGEEEVEAGSPQRRKSAHARKALMEAILHYPKHHLTPVAVLELGNLEAKSGHMDEAMDWYRRLVREWPRSPLVTESHYNRAIIQWQAGKTAVARQTFYQVVDGTPAHHLMPLAYSHIGRLHLEENDPDQALSPLRRALVASSSTPSQPMIALTTAAAYLLANNPRAANRTLVENRASVTRSEFLPATTFLDTFARYRMCTDKRQKQRETNDLLTCLLAPRDKNLLGAPGNLLLAQAYLEVGMQEPLIQFATKVMPGLRGPIATEMTMILADACFATGKQDRAGKLYADLAANKSRHSAQARFRLAEVNHKKRNANECLKWSRLVIEDRNPDHRRVTLRRMADAYEWIGDREKAILCLNGTPP